MANGTGLGAAIVFTTSSFTGSIVSIGGTELTREMLDVSHLGTSDYVAKIVGDLVDPGGFDIEFLFDPTEAAPPITGAAETITITFPNLGTTAATLAGTAAFDASSTPELAVGELMRGSGHISWTDGPTFTAGT